MEQEQKPTPIPVLRVASVTIKNVLGIVEQGVSPGKVTKISGRNASGKSSLLESIMATLRGGNLATLRNVDSEEEPEVVIVLQGPGNETYQVTKEGSKTVEVRKRIGESQGFKDVARPQEFLDRIFDKQTCNPVRFLLAKAKERIEMVLAALPITLDEELIDGIIKGFEMPVIPPRLHPLEYLSLIHDHLFATRTGTNRDGKNAAATVEQLLQEIPAEIGADPAPAIATLQEAISEEEKALERIRTAAESEKKAALAAIDKTLETAGKAASAKHKADGDAAKLAHQNAQGTLQTAAATELTKLDDRLAAALEAVRVSFRGEETAIRAALKEEQRKAQDSYSATVANLKTAYVNDVHAAEEEAEETRAEAEEDYGVHLSPLPAREATLAEKKLQLATLREREKNRGAVLALKRQADDFAAKAEDLAARSERLTKALDKLAAYRASLAETLPLKGVEIREGELYVGKVPYDQANMAKRVKLSVDVACLRAEGRRLPAIFVDGAESLDSQNLALLDSELQKRNVQAFIGRVEDTPLTITKS